VTFLRISLQSSAPTPDEVAPALSTSRKGISLSVKSPAPAAKPAPTEGALALGSKIRRLRKDKRLSLSRLGELSGIPISTLAKAETGGLSLPVDRLMRLADALGMAITELFQPTAAHQRLAALGRRSIIRAGKGVHTVTKNYECQWLFAELSQKLMFPVIESVRARTLQEFGPLLKHEGEEFTLVLKGRIQVLSEVYEPEFLEQHDGIYIDSRMGHAYLNAGGAGEEALILNVNTDHSLRRSAEKEDMRPSKGHRRR